MGRPRFGTDGVRGVANVELTAEVALALGRAPAARVLNPSSFVIGRDTRESGPMLEAAFSAGVAAEGVDVVGLGVLPTAGVAYWAERRGVPAAMVSASHNQYSDNGIKLFGPTGSKLAPEVEALIEAELDLLLDDPPVADPNTAHGAVGEKPKVGWLSSDPGALDLYRTHLIESLEGRRLDGLSVVVDCANGAASDVAPGVLTGLGASVLAISSDPDGRNINSGCGSTVPGPLAEAVRQHGADLGLALDGDADRLLAVDHAGEVLDGDVLLAVFAVDMAARGELTGDEVVVTVMTNLGFRRAMAQRGIAVRETPVGDRNVLVALDEGGLVLGGEQSGHIVFRRRATTGDGVLTGLLLADAVVRAGRPLADLAAGLVERVPQVLVNVPVAEPGRLAHAAEVWEAVAQVEAGLGAGGRVLLRPSGTEPLVRVMVEAPTAEQASAAVAELRKAVEGALGVHSTR